MASCTLATSLNADAALRFEMKAKDQGLTVSAAIRHLIEKWLTTGEPLRPILSGPLVRDISEEPDEDYYG